MVLVLKCYLWFWSMVLFMVYGVIYGFDLWCYLCLCVYCLLRVLRGTPGVFLQSLLFFFLLFGGMVCVCVRWKVDEVCR